MANILISVLDQNPSMNWQNKKDTSKFAIPKPVRLPPLAVPTPPDKRDAWFNPPIIEPTLGLFDKIINSRRVRRVNEAAEKNALACEAANQLFESTEQVWKSECQRIAVANSLKEASDKSATQSWEAARDAFTFTQQQQNASVDLERSRYLEGEDTALLSYIAEVLGQSEYPDSFPKEQRFQYSSTTKTLALDFELPNQTVLPEVKEVKYVATRSEFQKVQTSDLWNLCTSSESAA